MLIVEVESGCAVCLLAPCCGPGVAMVAAAGSMGNTSRVDLQAWLVDEAVKHSIKVVHQGKGQWQERHEGAHFAELLNSPDPKQRDRAVNAAAQLLMYMVGIPDGSAVWISDACMPWQQQSAMAKYRHSSFALNIDLPMTSQWLLQACYSAQQGENYASGV